MIIMIKVITRQANLFDKFSIFGFWKLLISNFWFWFHFFTYLLLCVTFMQILQLEKVFCVKIQRSTKSPVFSSGKIIWLSFNSRIWNFFIFFSYEHQAEKKQSHKYQWKSFLYCWTSRVCEETLVHNQIIPEGYSTWHEIIHAKFLLISIFAARALNWD